MRATVAILTYNGDDYLEAILSALETQQFDGDFEVLVIDSGSMDSTLQIVAAHPAVRLHQIPNSEFGHGKTRNLAAQLANGEFVAYLTHDAVPADDFWLSEMLEPFARFPEVEAVLGRQVARPDCVPVLKYEIRRAFDAQGPEFGTTISYESPAFARDPEYARRARIYSDVNSAARRAFLTGAIPYRDVPYAEDQLFAQDVLAAGKSKAYAGRGTVIHSNDLTYGQYGKRIFDEIVGLRQAGAEVPPLPGALRTLARALVLDPIDIVRDQEYPAGRKLYWLVVNPFYHLAKYRAVRRGLRVDLADARRIAQGSLEAERKKR
ncbi:hypothetical protein BH10ACT7_BH10ACT7_11190 [soil metagenome]